MTAILLTILLYSFLGWFLCDIDPSKDYSWYHGIWHGMFFTINFVRSWFGDALYKADNYTTGYNIFYWIFSIISVISTLSGGKSSR